MEEINQMTFQSKLIKTDVTAVKILQCDRLLIGIGSTASLYQLSNQKFLGKKNIFIGQKIYGFVPNLDECIVAVYGGKLVKVCCIKTTIQSDEPQSIRYFDGYHNFTCNDWILSLIWKKTDSIVVLTAHNVIQVWSTTTNEKMAVYNCDEKCILYSGYLSELNDGILVMGGTVFSQVVIWNSQNSLVQQRIMGHKGVIFSIFYCMKKDLIITTSDDRSVRIWSVISKTNENSKTISHWTNTQIDPMATLFGHTARVMRGIVLDEMIVSIGEDGLMCLWSLNGNLIKKKKIHQGGCLWTVDSDTNKKMVVTGGSDSGVLIHHIENVVPNITALDPPDEKCVCKKVVFTANGSIVCYTEQGGLFYYDMKLNQWNSKYQIAFAKSCHILAISLCRHLISVAGINGNIIIFEETLKNKLELYCESVIEGKILSLHWVSDKNLIICGQNGIITSWYCSEKFCTKLAEYCLPTSKERWLTVAAVVPKKELLIVGDRCGSVHIFKKNCTLPSYSLQKVHGRLGINEITFAKQFVVTTGRNGSVKYFLLRDDDNEEKPYLEYYYDVKVPFDWVEKFIGYDNQIVCGFHETSLVVWNMKKHSYVLDINCGGGHRSWDLITDVTACKAEKQSTIQIAFIKNFRVHLLKEEVCKNDCRTIEEGSHVKEINDLQTIEYSVNDSKYFIVLSGGEDSAIRISLSEMNGDNFTYEENLKITKHASSIRCMTLHHIHSTNSKDHKDSILFTGGGRAQICVWKITVKSSDNKPHIELKEISNYMLKGTDLERKKSAGLSNEVDMTGETRFMSLNCILDESEYFNARNENYTSFILFAGCSDGVLRIYSFLYSEKTNCALTLKKSIHNDNKCILKVSSFVFKNKIILISMSVDGVVKFWDLKRILSKNDVDITPFHQIKMHKAGINSFDMKFLTEDKLIIATGGDDNRICLNVSSISLNEDNFLIENICEWSSSNIHCAQVTGLKLINDFLITTSIDQRLTVLQWNYITDSKQLQCKHNGQYHSSVSDVQGLNVCHFDGNNLSVFIFGKGFEVVSLELQQDNHSL